MGGRSDNLERQIILNQLVQSIRSKEPIVGVSIGGGRSAKQAASGGADLLLALNSGRFRMVGVASTAGMLPFANSNQMVFDFGSKEVLPRVKNIPVVFGACAQDMTLTHQELLNKIESQGFDGINNFPTVSLIDGQYREALEENGEGFNNEVDLLKMASQRGMFTVAFAVTQEEAIAMAKANVDILCLHFGWTYLKTVEGPTVDDLINKANTIFAEVFKIKPTIIPMIYGGAVVKNPEMTTRFYKETKVVGYIGGSVFEVMPNENSIKDATDRFKNFYKVKELEKENETLRKQLLMQKGVHQLIGDSKTMKEIIDLIPKVAHRDSNILIEGESGTGKDLVVKTIHYSSPRAMDPFIKVNCATIPTHLMESELFGHEKGAFLGADSQHIGRFELANKGTLFLDNITELSLDVQAKLLRVIQDQEFERVGGNETLHIDVRIISTTNKDIKEELAVHRFREDLYYLLNVVTIHMSPLRSHKEDIPLLVDRFIDELNERYNTTIHLTPQVMESFMRYDWPGNVRELRNALERGSILCESNVMDVRCLPPVFHSGQTENSTINYVKQSSMIVEKELLLTELQKANWNQTRVAEKLGMTRRTLYNKIKKYGLEK